MATTGHEGTIIREPFPTIAPDRLALEFSDHEGAVTTVYPKGDVDVFTADDIEKLAAERIASGQRSFVFNLTETEYFDGSFFAVLVRVLKKVREFGGNVCLVVDEEQKSARRILSITGLDTVFKPHSDLETALQHLS